MHPAQLDALGRGTVGTMSDVTHWFACKDSNCIGNCKIPAHDANPLHVVDRVVGRTRQEVEARITALENEDYTYREYLLLKFHNNDLHGVEDAASDLRDIEAALGALRWVLGE